MKNISLRFNQIINASLLVMTLISFSIVILRYFFGLGWVWLQESVLYFHSFIFLFGSIRTLKLDKHVRVDVLYNSFSKEKKNLVNKIGFLILATPFCLTLFYVSFSFTLDSWKWLEKSSDAGGLSFVYIMKTFIPLFAFILVTQAFLSHFYHPLKNKSEGLK